MVSQCVFHCLCLCQCSCKLFLNLRDDHTKCNPLRREKLISCQHLVFNYICRRTLSSCRFSILQENWCSPTQSRQVFPLRACPCTSVSRCSFVHRYHQQELHKTVVILDKLMSNRHVCGWCNIVQQELHKTVVILDKLMSNRHVCGWCNIVLY